MKEGALVGAGAGGTVATDAGGISSAVGAGTGSWGSSPSLMMVGALGAGAGGTVATDASGISSAVGAGARSLGSMAVGAGGAGAGG